MGWFLAEPGARGWGAEAGESGGRGSRRLSQGLEGGGMGGEVGGEGPSCAGAWLSGTPLLIVAAWLTGHKVLAEGGVLIAAVTSEKKWFRDAYL